jgi:hypothetical protein
MLNWARSCKPLILLRSAVDNLWITPGSAYNAYYVKLAGENREPSRTLAVHPRSMPFEPSPLALLWIAPFYAVALIVLIVYGLFVSLSTVAGFAKLLILKGKINRKKFFSSYETSTYTSAKS